MLVLGLFGRVTGVNNQPHTCPDWDFLFIRPGDPEMECCTCADMAAIRAAFAEMKPGMSGPFDECQMLPPSADLD